MRGDIIVVYKAIPGKKCFEKGSDDNSRGSGRQSFKYRNMDKGPLGHKEYNDFKRSLNYK